MANGKITGKVYKQTEGSLVDTWGEGYFLALKFEADDWSKYTSVKVGLDPSESSGLVEILEDPDKNGAFKITNPEEQKFKIVATNGTKTVTQVYDLEDLDGYYWDEGQNEYAFDNLWKMGI